MTLNLETLRRYAIARSLFDPTTLPLALSRLGFVQADPLRAPARAQDLTLRHRVDDYRAGDLERRYPSSASRRTSSSTTVSCSAEHHALMHPRKARARWSKARQAKADAVLAFVRERGTVHPREVDAHFKHGKVTNWFGGSSNASTELLDGMHYRGLLRVARRDAGTRVYAARDPWPAVNDRAQIRVAHGHDGRPRRCHLRTAAVEHAGPARALAAPGRAAMGGRPSARADSREEAPRPCTGRRHRLVLAGRRRSGVGRALRRRSRVAAGAVRPGGVGPTPLRALLGLAVPLRGLHAGRQAQARPLRAAAAVARAGRRLGQRVGRGRRDATRGRLRRPAASTEPAFVRAIDDELHRLHRFLGPAAVRTLRPPRRRRATALQRWPLPLRQRQAGRLFAAGRLPLQPRPRALISAAATSANPAPRSPRVR